MIVAVLLEVVFVVVDFILSLLGTIPGFPEGFLSSIISYIQTVITGGSGLFFFFIRPSTFLIAIDIVFFVWYIEPLYKFIIWVLKKIPFLNIE